MDGSELKSQFNGFVNTPNLWGNDAVYGLNQYKLFDLTAADLTIQAPNLRLGKRVEQFVSVVLNNDPSTFVLAENVQIQKEKISIGELDCLLKQLDKLVHLEIVFKFYLYDNSLGSSELGKWIGPNRNDDLVKKLTKLKEKQLPLLHKEETIEAIRKIGNKLQIEINPSEITQKVLFRAQLFVPRKLMSSPLPVINNECIVGFYVAMSELSQLQSNSFHIPSKINWLQEPSLSAEWLDMIPFESQIQLFINEKRSPLCWLKDTKGNMQKFFVVWW